MTNAIKIMKSQTDYSILTGTNVVTQQDIQHSILHKYTNQYSIKVENISVEFAKGKKIQDLQ